MLHIVHAIDSELHCGWSFEATSACSIRSKSQTNCKYYTKSSQDFVCRRVLMNAIENKIKAVVCTVRACCVPLVVPI